MQHFSHDYGLASHTTNVVCLSFIREWRNIESNVDSGRPIFGKRLRGRFIYFQSFSQKFAERKLTKKYFSFSYFVLMSDLGYGPGLYD